MGTTFKSITEGTFNSVGASYRPMPWAAKWDGSASNLQRSTTMAKSFHLRVDDDSATLSNPMPYAAAHQFGATIRSKSGGSLVFKLGDKTVFAKKVTIPPRPFFPVLNGKLTPAAEEKIAAAARRVITTIAAGR